MQLGQNYSAWALPRGGSAIAPERWAAQEVAESALEWDGPHAEHSWWMSAHVKCGAASALPPSFQPRTRAGRRRRLLLGLLSLVLWIVAWTFVLVVMLEGDTIGMALLFTGASFVVAFVYLVLIAVAQRRRRTQGATPGPPFDEASK
jgi:hypothetical protein